jgi:hypothetical protein
MLLISRSVYLVVILRGRRRRDWPPTPPPCLLEIFLFNTNSCGQSASLPFLTHSRLHWQAKFEKRSPLDRCKEGEEDPATDFPYSKDAPPQLSQRANVFLFFFLLLLWLWLAKNEDISKWETHSETKLKKKRLVNNQKLYKEKLGWNSQFHTHTSSFFF